MTKKHFEMIADEMAEIRPANEEQFKTWRSCVDVIANVCYRSNNRFDRFRFIDACMTRESYIA